MQLDVEIPKIGFEIYKHNRGMETGTGSELVAIGTRHNSNPGIGRYSAERAISLNCELAKGSYLVLLSTYDPNQFGEFTFSIWYPKGSAEWKRLSLTKLGRRAD